jgi:acetyl-CoA C-acetyltransferase
MSSTDVVILSGCRTAIGTFGGVFKDVSAVELGTVAVREAVRRSGVRPDQVDEVIFGCILQAGLGMNPARQAAIKAGLPDSVPATTVNKVCGSGLQSAMMAAQAIKAGDAEIVVAGGTENMSRAPYLLPGARWGERLGNGTIVDHMIHEGLTDAFHDIHMGVTAENLVERYGIRARTRMVRGGEPAPGGVRDQERRVQGRDRARRRPRQEGRDARRHRRTSAAGHDGGVPGQLKPAFKKDGTVTAGNSSGLNDGAAALVGRRGRRSAWDWRRSRASFRTRRRRWIRR